MASVGNADAGIVYAPTGVCHQIADCILRDTESTVTGVRGYWTSVAMFKTFGKGNWPEVAACHPGRWCRVP